MRLALPLRRVMDDWLFQLKSFEQGEVVLNQRRVFILPTRAGLAWALMLIGLFIGSVNYQINMGYALTFLVAGCAMVGILLTFRNLAWLHLTPGRAHAAFAGGEVIYEFRVSNRSATARYAIEIGFASRQDNPDGRSVTVDLPSHAETTVRLSAPALRRGWQPVPRIRLQTRFPLGLLRAWSTWSPDMSALVYPEPEKDGPGAPLDAAGSRDGAGRAGRDDFAGVRAWQAGDSPSRLAWRQIARMGDAGSTLVSKHFEGGANAELAIEESAAAGLELEARLSRMTRWILEAEQRGQSWRFALGPQELAAGAGPAHCEHCLRLLALHREARP